MVMVVRAVSRYLNFRERRGAVMVIRQSTRTAYNTYLLILGRAYGGNMDYRYL